MRNMIMMICAAALLLAGCDKPRKITASDPSPTPAVLDTSNNTISAKDAEALKIKLPSPTPGAFYTEEELKALAKKIVADSWAEWEKAHPSPTPTAAPKSSPIPIPDMINPFETEEERMAKAARQGLALINEKGERWAVLSRDDGKEVTRGLPEELTAIQSGEFQPICVREAEGWVVRWIAPGANASPTPVSTPSASPTPASAPTQPPTASPEPSLPDV